MNSPQELLKKVNYSYRPFLKSQISTLRTPHTEVRVACGPGRPHNTVQQPRTPQGPPTSAQTLKRTRATPPPAPWRPQGGPAEAQMTVRAGPDGPRRARRGPCRSTRAAGPPAHGTPHGGGSGAARAAPLGGPLCGPTRCMRRAGWAGLASGPAGLGQRAHPGRYAWGTGGTGGMMYRSPSRSWFRCEACGTQRRASVE